VKHTGPLKIRGFVAVDETPIAKQHRAQHSSNFRLTREQRVDFVAQTAPHAS
jgi:hypothetical protein